MNKKYNGFNLIWILIIVVITSIISALTAGVIVYNNNKISSKVTYADLANDEELAQFLEVYANITSEYYEDVNKEELLEKAISAMMSYLGDDYTTYLDDDTTNDLMNQLSGEYTGIGVAIENDTKTITKVYDDTPASKSGIKAGDIIIEYNSQDVTSMSTTEVVNLIKNDSDNFTLTLKRGNEIVNVTLKNEKIISPSIDYKILEDTSIGYLAITTFSSTLATQVNKALEELESEGITSLIIDLRNNTGGYLEAATDVASMFLAKGETIYSLDYKGEISEYKDETSTHRTYNIVVLINENTASASEVVAAALKESYGAILVGETSYGKGKVQQTMSLEGGSMVKYTSAYWLTPSGTCIDQVGIKPDYEIANDSSQDTNESVIVDDQLEKAKSILQNNE